MHRSIIWCLQFFSKRWDTLLGYCFMLHTYLTCNRGAQMRHLTRIVKLITTWKKLEMQNDRITSTLQNSSYANYSNFCVLNSQKWSKLKVLLTQAKYSCMTQCRWQCPTCHVINELLLITWQCNQKMYVKLKSYLYENMISKKKNKAKPSQFTPDWVGFNSHFEVVCTLNKNVHGWTTHFFTNW